MDRLAVRIREADLRRPLAGRRGRRADDPPDSALQRPDLEVRTLLGVINGLNRKRRLEDYSVAEGRRDLRLAATMAGTREAVGAMHDRTVETDDGPVPVRVYMPAAGLGPHPVLVWIHGGGFVLGCREMADGTCRALVNRSGAAVVSVDYRLAPEHDLSAGRRDCLAVVEWLRRQGRELGLDPQRIAVGGDSAGGNLSALVAQHCAARGVDLALQVLVYPATDLRIDYADHPFAHGHLLTYEVMNWLKSLIPDDLDASDPWLSPALAESVAGVAPALVLTAGCDPLKEDGLAYVERLRREGVAVESLHYPGQVHGFLTFDLLLHAARDALVRIGAALHRAFAASGPVPGAPFGPALRLPQLPSLRRRMTEMHFDQLVLSQFMLDSRRFVLGRLGTALWQPSILDGAASPHDAHDPGLAWPRRYAEAVSDATAAA